LSQNLFSLLADIPSGSLDGSPLLAIRDVNVRFDGLRALSEISVDVYRNELIAVVGPNGAGKTTLLNAISGLLGDSVSGEVSLCGKSILHTHPAAIAAAGVARSFQNPPLIESESVLQNMLLGAHLRLGYRMIDQIVRRRAVAAREREATQLAVAVLEFAGLARVIHRPVAGLPYGSRKIIDIARTLMSSPKLVLLDEPTSGLDMHERELVKNLLIELRKSTGLAILVVEHHMDIVRATADRVIGLQAGAVLAVGTAAEVLDSEEFRSSVVGSRREPPSESIIDTTAVRSTG
jgi:ABC-type branched-subunit amino acid transport system ATPase component